MSYQRFIESIKYGNINKAKSNFDFEYFNKEDKYGLKPIHWGCLSSNIEILEWMLEENCNIETSTRNGWRPIHFASFVGNEKMVKFLMEKFCELDCKTDNGETVLDVANGDCNHEFIDRIFNENINWKIGLSIGLKCDGDCNHEFCLRSVVQCNFAKDKLIGRGIFADIYKIKSSHDYQQFAVKIIMSSKYDSFANANCILPNINQILPSLNHRKIVKLFGMIKTEIEMILFMELMSKRSLWHEIISIGALKHDKIRQYSKDILQAVTFLHHSKILHGFITSENILIDNNGGCKLAISNFSCSLANIRDQIVKYLMKSYYTFSPPVAPEIIHDESLSYPYDIWWAGCLVIEMSTGDYMRYQWDIATVLDKIISEIPNEMLKIFIKSMMVKNSKERPKANDLLNHEFIRNESNDNSNNNQSIIDNSIITHNNSINIIQNAIDNKQIGLSMGLKCDGKCQHKFCLSSVTATHFKKSKTIGERAYGKVCKIKLKSGSHFSKKIIKNVDENIKEKTKCFVNDINRYRKFINHDNIMKYFGAVRNLRKICIFIEFINGESLYQIINKNKCKPLPLTTIKQYTKQILKGLKFLHNLKIIHRDIKSANISDLGLIKFTRTILLFKNKIFCGTPNYMSPEVIIDEAYDCSVDIWSLGATVFEMTTGHPPYHEMHETDVISIISNSSKNEYQ